MSKKNSWKIYLVEPITVTGFIFSSCWGIFLFVLYIIDPMIMVYVVKDYVEHIHYSIIVYLLGMSLVYYIHWVKYLSVGKGINEVTSHDLRSLTIMSACLVIPTFLMGVYLWIIEYCYAENLDQYFNSYGMLFKELALRFVGLIFVEIIDIITMPGRFVVKGILKVDGEIFGIPVGENPLLAYLVYGIVTFFIGVVFKKLPIKNFRLKIWAKVKPFLHRIWLFLGVLWEIYTYREP